MHPRRSQPRPSILAILAKPTRTQLPAFQTLLTVIGCLALLFPAPARAQHGHLNAGAAGTQQNDRLLWANGADFVSTSGYIKTLDYTNAGRYAGYFQQNITLTVLPATGANAGPDPAAPALGAFLRVHLTCSDAPPGGTFAFWEAGATMPTLSVGAGQSAATPFAISQGDGAPASDPYGHIHGRRFTATKPGLYKITFRAIDTSTNGAGGGPIHTPSDPISIWFQAGVPILSIEPDFEEDHVHLRFAPPLGTSWQVEASASPAGDAAWEPVGPVVNGNDLLIETLIGGAPNPQRFYRLRRTAP